MNLKSFRMVFRNTVLVDLEYRVNYIMLLLSSVITIVMEWAVFAHVFSGRDEVGGLPKESAFTFVFYGLLIRLVQILWNVVGEGINEIRDGSFRRYLLQPIHHPIYFFAQVIGTKFTPLLMAIVACVIYKLFDSTPESFLSWDILLPAVLAFVLSTLMLWMLYLNVLYLAFFVEESFFFQVAINLSLGVLSGAILPLSWFPTWFQSVARLTPFPVVGDWPLRSALGLMPMHEWWSYFLSALIWLGIFLASALTLQKQGLRRYEAFGG